MCSIVPRDSSRLRPINYNVTRPHSFLASYLGMLGYSDPLRGNGRDQLMKSVATQALMQPQPPSSCFVNGLLVVTARLGAAYGAVGGCRGGCGLRTSAPPIALPPKACNSVCAAVPPRRARATDDRSLRPAAAEVCVRGAGRGGAERRGPPCSSHALAGRGDPKRSKAVQSAGKGVLQSGKQS